MVQARWTIPKRRSDWRLGRWTAKAAVAKLVARWWTGPIEIRAADSGAPEVFFGSVRAKVTISISHRNGLACCVAIPGTAALGCDLEAPEPRSPAFVDDYFTESEKALIAESAPASR